MKYSLLILSLIFLISCKSNKPTTGQETGGKVLTETGTAKTDTVILTSPKAGPDSLRLVVFFYSQASGAEFELVNELIDSVEAYSKNLGQKIEYKKIPWGREGETDVTFKLNELTPVQQTDFVAMARRVLAKGKFVTIYENYPYKQRGR